MIVRIADAMGGRCPQLVPFGAHGGDMGQSRGAQSGEATSLRVAGGSRLEPKMSRSIQWRLDEIQRLVRDMNFPHEFAGRKRSAYDIGRNASGAARIRTHSPGQGQSFQLRYIGALFPYSELG